MKSLLKYFCIPADTYVSDSGVIYNQISTCLYTQINLQDEDWAINPYNVPQQSTMFLFKLMNHGISDGSVIRKDEYATLKKT